MKKKNTEIDPRPLKDVELNPACWVALNGDFRGVGTTVGEALDDYQRMVYESMDAHGQKYVLDLLGTLSDLDEQIEHTTGWDVEKLIQERRSTWNELYELYRLENCALVPCTQAAKAWYEDPGADPREMGKPQHWTAPFNGIMMTSAEIYDLKQRFQK